MSKNIENISVPPILMDNLNRSHGVILFSGNRYSGYEKTFKVISDKIKNEQLGSMGTIVLKDKTDYQDSFWKPITYDDLILRPLDENTKKSDYFIFENISKPIEFEAALEIAEDGRFIFMHFSCTGVMNGLHRLFSFYQNEQRKHYLWRLLDETFLFYSQIEIQGENNLSQLAGEIILLNQDLKKIVIEGGIHLFEERIKQLNEDSGIVTLNQSLLQLLIRRKISLKKAFEVTRDPNDLDALLKKVGI